VCAALDVVGRGLLKVDDLSEPYHTSEIEQIRGRWIRWKENCFQHVAGADAHFTGGHIAAQANLWRISGDFWDRWAKINEQFDLIASWSGAGGPEHWPDADMIPLGYIAIRSKLGGNPHWTHFTRDETTHTDVALVAGAVAVDAGDEPDG